MRSLYAGLDVSDRTVSICIIDSCGSVILEDSVPTNPKEIAGALRPYRRKLRQVAQETGTKAAWLHKELLKHRLPMVCLDARHAKAALNAKLNKTDKNDARGLATLLARGIFTEAHVKSDTAQAELLLLNSRKILQKKAIDVQLYIGTACKSLGVNLEKRDRRIVVRKKGPQLAPILNTLHRTSAVMLKEVAVFDKAIARAAAADPVCKRFMTMPGVGPITALTFKATVDDPNRFESSRDVAAHLGLTPRLFQSGERSYSGHISGFGDDAARRALYSAASSLISVSRSRCHLALWARDLRRRRGFKVAATACARRMAVILHRMWLTEQPFIPEGSRPDRRC
jgi:transposase